MSNPEDLEFGTLSGVLEELNDSIRNAEQADRRLEKLLRPSHDCAAIQAYRSRVLGAVAALRAVAGDIGQELIEQEIWG